MIRIPKYEPRQITTRVGNIDPGFVQPLVNRVGQDAASSTAQSLLDSGKQLTDVAIKEYVSQETARVSQSLLAMKGDMAAERDRYMQENQGEKALGAGAHFEQFAQKTAQDYMQKGGFSGKFAQMFTQQAAMDALSFTETGQAYGRQQKQAWQDSVIKGETESFLADAAQHYNDPEWLEANRPAIQERINNLRPGMDNRALFAQLDQQAAASTIEGYLANNNVGGARAWLKQNGAMAGEKLNGFVDKVNARGRELEARARAERAERQFDVRSRAQDAIAAWNSGQDSPTAPSKQEVISAYGAEKGGRIWQSLESSQQFGSDMKTLGTMTPEQQNELLEKRTPTPGDGFASAQENYERLTRAIKADQEWRLKDQVSYLLTNDKDTQAAFKAWQDSPSPENTQAYVMKLQAAAAARGIRQSASETQPVLPGNAAKDLAWRISNSEKPAEVIAQQKAAWGDYWPSVERQLVHDDKMPGGLRVVASGMDAQSGGLLASTFRNPEVCRAIQGCSRPDGIHLQRYAPACPN